MCKGMDTFITEFHFQMRKTILIASIPCRCSAYLAVDVKKDFQACGCSLCLMKFGSIVNTLQTISCLCKKQIVLE